MRGLKELVFSVTNRCTAKCQDCPIVREGDPPTQLSPEDMMPVVDEVLDWGALQLVVFTGGEPFLLGEDLAKMVKYVSDKGVMTRIVTNAYWATSREKAAAILRELKDAGLTEINYSCDDYHQEFVPLENIRNAHEAAREVELPALLGHRKKHGGKITVEFLSEYLGVDLKLFKKGEDNSRRNDVILSGPNVPLDDAGRPGHHTRWEISEDDGRWRGACDSVMKSIIISSDLQVQICCGIAYNSIGELYIGSLKEESLLSILQRGNRDLITNWLALEGPASVLDFVRSKKPDIDLPEQFVGRCHVCNELFTNPEVRQVLREHAHEHIDSVLLMRGALDWISDDWAPASGKAAACAVA